jgi:nitrile hydratase accessory protein
MTIWNLLTSVSGPISFNKEMSPFTPDPAQFSNNPLPENETIFQAPWQAKAFAIVNQLITTQHCNWAEWTNYLAAEIFRTEAENLEASSYEASTYYEQWIRACEKLLIAKGLLEQAAIEQKIKAIQAELQADHSPE